MTVIVIRDGVMAVDSLVASDTVRMGTVQKWREVAAEPGGYVAATGDVGPCAAAMDAIAARGEAAELRNFEGSVLWLRADGTTRIFAMGGWFDVQGPYHAEGSGCDVAMGALAMGATAERAAWVACDLVTTCGGPVTALRVKGRGHDPATRHGRRRGPRRVAHLRRWRGGGLGCGAGARRAGDVRGGAVGGRGWAGQRSWFLVCG